MINYSQISFAFMCVAFLSGCVVIPQKSSDLIVSENLKPVECTPTAINSTFYEEFRNGYTTKNYINARKRDPSEVEYISDYIKSEVDEKKYFDNSSNNPDLKIDFRTYYSSQSNIAEQAWYWSTVATLGLLPSWGHGKVRIEASVTDSKGKKIGEFASSEEGFHTVNWLFLAPFNIGDRNSSKKLIKRVIPKLTDDLLNQMIQAKIICKH